MVNFLLIKAVFFLHNLGLKNLIQGSIVRLIFHFFNFLSLVSLLSFYIIKLLKKLKNILFPLNIQLFLFVLEQLEF